MRAAIDRRVPARLLADPHAVHDFSGDGAAHRTVGTNVFANYCAMLSGPVTAASALRTVPSGIVPSTARLPAPIPERRKNARRSRAVLWAASPAREPRRAG